MMDAVAGDALDAGVELDYMRIIKKYASCAPNPVRLERFAFYERAKTAFAVVVTGEQRKYGNLILKKGVTPVRRGSRAKIVKGREESSKMRPMLQR